MTQAERRELQPNQAALAGASGAVSIPAYISGHYRWAYLWKPGVWFFDHMPVINCIVFGQYRNMVDATLAYITDDERTGETVLIASAYGNLVPRLAERLGDNPLTVIDVAPIQLHKAERKLVEAGLRERAELHLMDAEALEFEDDSFDTGMMFLLLNEMPPEARDRALRHALRVIRPGGQLIVTEYGELGHEHFLHRFPPTRWLVRQAEPWLDSLWRQDLAALVSRCAESVGKTAALTDRTLIFDGFYRVKRFEVGAP
ncbi:MAG: class I SAM-dependent methyltransferase [Wenzhouxiangellaceae bacterium]|nr:class I SAM-dependent methyltransferase [Wenzhouxiangellaceae bacterium]